MQIPLRVIYPDADVARCGKSQWDFQWDSIVVRNETGSTVRPDVEFEIVATWSATSSMSYMPPSASRPINEVQRGVVDENWGPSGWYLPDEKKSLFPSAGDGY